MLMSLFVCDVLQYFCRFHRSNRVFGYVFWAEMGMSESYFRGWGAEVCEEALLWLKIR